MNKGERMELTPEIKTARKTRRIDGQNISEAEY